MREIKFRAWNVIAKEMMFHKNTCEGISEFWHAIAIGQCYEPMQFTGLYDKNGKEIYEGDITDRGVIKFQTNLSWDSGGSLHSGFYFETYNDEGDLEYHDGMDDCIVIGNIYENPELLAEK